MVVDGAVVMIENIVRHLSLATTAPDLHRERISDAAHEVQRPVFYAIAIIITAYLPIFTLQRVEGRLFQPMAWTVAFALLGALFFSISSPRAGQLRLRQRRAGMAQPGDEFLTERYRDRRALGHSPSRHHRRRVSCWHGCWPIYLAFSGVIGSEFLPHLDEGALWVRGTLAPSTGPDEGIRVANQARIVLCSFPEVPQCTSQVGRPDDGTDTTGFFNTEYFVDLKPKEQWRPVFHENKEELIAAMQRELDKIPGASGDSLSPLKTTWKRPSAASRANSPPRSTATI